MPIITAMSRYYYWLFNSKTLYTKYITTSVESNVSSDICGRLVGQHTSNKRLENVIVVPAHIASLTFGA